jgi:hypothetical protein
MREALAPAFAHLATPGSSNGDAITIDIWDGESSGVEPPPLPWQPSEIRDLGEVERFSDDPIRTVCDVNYGAFTVVDQARRKALFQVPAASRIPWYERAAPVRTALHHLLAPTGATLVHAGAAGLDGGAALIVGRGGSGKSTLATAAAMEGMGFTGDDYVALTVEAEPVAHSIHCTAKLSAESLTLLSRLGTVHPRWGGGDDKFAVDLYRDLPESVRRSQPLNAIVVPRVTTGAPRWERTAGGEGLRALAPSTMLQLPVASGPGLAHMAKLARSVPSYALDLGDDPGAAVSALREVLGDAG